MNTMNEKWDELQFRQELHDQLFHGDIYHLAKPHRLTHLVLHHCKYTSKIHTLYRKEISTPSGNYEWFKGDPESKQTMLRLCVDGMIVSLSMLNIANFRFSKLLAIGPFDMGTCVDILIHNTGRLAKTVEDIDHMMQTKPIDAVVHCLAEMTTSYMTVFKILSDGDQEQLIDAIYARLNTVESYNMFAHERQTQMLSIINTARSRRGLHALTTEAAYISA